MQHIDNLKLFLKNPVVVVIEFLLLCVALPTIVIVFKLAPKMFFFLWGATLYCIIVYCLCLRQKAQPIWNLAAVTTKTMKPILYRFICASLCMYLFLLWYDPDRLFGLLNSRPEIIPVLLVMYPLISALPQEFIFCTFFFERYRSLFTTPQRMVLASSVVFAYAHVLFINPVAPVLSFLAGLIFARTYQKTQSLAVVTIEHGLYGNALFLIGLGWYFWGGAVH